MAKYPIRPVKIFYCYAHEDDALREQLARHLSPLRRLRDITGWFDRDIGAGTNWQRESEAEMDTASIILLLISADFIASDYCYAMEMKRALEKQKAGAACVIPILILVQSNGRTHLADPASADRPETPPANEERGLASTYSADLCPCDPLWNISLRSR